MRKKTDITGIILLILSIVLALGTAFLFHACPAKEDGSFMSCHWAQQTVIGLGLVMAVISAMHLGARSQKTKMGISLALIPVSVFTALVPKCVINLCMMNEMRCHTTMRPAVIILAVLIAVTAAADVLMQKKEAK